MLVYAVLGLSLVLLSGWGGIVSLGQIAFFATGVGGDRARRHRVGRRPVRRAGRGHGRGRAPRRPGRPAGAAAPGPVPGRHRSRSLPTPRRSCSTTTTSAGSPPSASSGAAGRLQVESESAVYYLALAVLVVMMAGLRGVRTSRFGRALVALRDNEAAAASFGVDPLRLRLGASAVRGRSPRWPAACSCTTSGRSIPSSYSPIENLVVLTMVVVGGMTSLAGAVLGAVPLRGALVSRPRVAVPGLGHRRAGRPAARPRWMAGLAYQARDLWLRAVAARKRSGGRGLRGGGRARRSSFPAGAGRKVNGAESAAPCSGSACSPVRHRPAGTALLDVVGIEVGYGGVPVLGVDLAVREGEAGASAPTGRASRRCCGRSGPRPAAGQDHVRRRGLAGLAPHQVAARGVVQMPGGTGVFPSLTVDEVLAGGRLAAPARCRRHGRRAGQGARAVPGPGRTGPATWPATQGRPAADARWPWPWSCGPAC